MYKIIKVLNNNTILACNETEEVIIIKELDFQRKWMIILKYHGMLKNFLCKRDIKLKVVQMI